MLRSPRGGGGAVALLVLGVLSCERRPQEPSRASGVTPPAASASRNSPGPSSDSSDVSSRRRRPSGGRAPVIWLGLDGFDFELVDRLAGEGRMPHWKRLSSEGYTARLTSFVPILSPIVWTTLATGVGPDIHRVLDFQQLDPATGMRVPISGNSRAVPAIWNVASESGLTVGVVGWWATHPAEEVKGFFVSDHASPILFEGLPRQGLAFPPSLSAGVEQISGRESVVSSEELARFVAVPAGEIAAARGSEQGLSNKLVLLARAIGATRAESRIARELYDRNLPDLTMLYLEGTDVVGHLFASDVPPRMSCVSDADFARYSHTVDEYYALVDRVLGQWMRRAEEDGATLIVNSDHGFKWGEDRSCDGGSFDPATAGFWHRLDGVFAAWGARVNRNGERGHASVFDVEPTVAALLGLPVERRAPGRPMLEAFRGLSPPPRKDLASEIAVRRLAAEPMSEKEASEYSKRLMALGYLSGARSGKLAPPGGDRPGLTEAAWNNLGLYLSNLGGEAHMAAAVAAFQKSLELSPGDATPKLHLAEARRARGEEKEAIDLLFQAIAAGQSSPERVVLDWAMDYDVKGRELEARTVLERGARLYPDDEPIHRALALLFFKAKDCRSADAALSRFETTTHEPQTLNTLGLVRACLGRRDEAIALFRRSLALVPDQKTVIESLDLLQKSAASIH